MFFRVDDTDDGAISRRIFTLERKACFPSPAPKDQLANSSAYRIDCYHRFSLWLQILIQRLNHQELAPRKRFILDGCYDCADDASELHVEDITCPRTGRKTKNLKLFFSGSALVLALDGDDLRDAFAVAVFLEFSS
jgi:hypothetical protein